MSDDEEVICKGKDLYKHLIDQGYSDFGTFESNFSSDNEGSKDVIHTNNFPNNFQKKCIFISSQEYQQIEVILNSKLLFKEDFDVILTAAESLSIDKNTSKWFWHFSACAGLLSSFFLRRRGLLFYLPCGFTILTASYSLWDHIKETILARKFIKLRSHVDLLKDLCTDFQKLLRFLRETELLSGNKLTSQKLMSIAYVQVNDGENESKRLFRESQPHLRKCLLDSMNYVINTLSVASNDLQKTNIYSHHGDFGEVLSDKSKLYVNIDPTSCISLRELQSVNETYLALQSEYLKFISFNICPSLISFSYTKNNVNLVYTMFKDIELKLRDISFQLKMQYNLNNIYFPINIIESRNFNEKSNEMSSLQLEVHNMFLLILSLMLRVKNLEDFLANISSDSAIENENETTESIGKHLNMLKDDLNSTAKSVDYIYNKLFNMNDSHENQSTAKKENQAIQIIANIKRTGVVVGASDFAVNSPDEVFLAISGIHNENQEAFDDDDDWMFEKKPQIPANLLRELSKRLKIRQQRFREREKAALLRQGLLDFPETSGEISDSYGNVDENCSFLKPTSRKFLFAHGSENEESCGEKLKYRQTKSNSKYYFDSDSDGSGTDSEVNLSDEPKGRVNENQLSLANLVAKQSQLWRNTSEECFSDG